MFDTCELRVDTFSESRLQKSSISHPEIIDFRSKMRANGVPCVFAVVAVLQTAPGRVPRLTFFKFLKAFGCTFVSLFDDFF